MSLSNKTNKVILGYYKSNGLHKTIQLCARLLMSEVLKKQEDISFVIGEIAESVLEIMIIHYIKINKLKDWSYKKSLVIKDITSNNKEYLTEIDLVLFTPSTIILFESKSYKGDKVIKDRGMLVRGKGRSFDVFEQHRKHTLVFSKTFNPFIKENVDSSKAYLPAIFSFSEGSMKDLREEKYKNLMPVIQVNNLFPLLNSITHNPKCWNLHYVRKAVSIIERQQEIYRGKHIKYVGDLNANRSNKK